MTEFTEWRSLVDGERINAIPDTVEDFERTDPLSDYSGDTGQFSIITDDPIEGEKSLEATDDSNGPYIITRSGEYSKPEQGQEFQVEFRPEDSDVRLGLLFGLQDPDNWYAVQLEASAGRVTLLKDGDSLDSVDGSMTVGDTYTYTVKWGSDGNLTAEYTDNEETTRTASATDSEYSDGDIGWRVFRTDASSNIAVADNVRITELL